MATARPKITCLPSCRVAGGECEPVLQQHFELILWCLLVDQSMAGVVAQLAAPLVVGQFGAGLMASSPGRPSEDEADPSIAGESRCCQYRSRKIVNNRGEERGGEQPRLDDLVDGTRRPWVAGPAATSVSEL